MRKWRFLVFFSVLLLVSCVAEKPVTNVETEKPVSLPDIEEIPEEESIEEPVEQAENDMSQFFLPDEKTAYFKGDGNEFATYTTRTEWLDDRHVNIYENNGGVELIKSYRLEDDKIVVLQEVPIGIEKYSVTIEELDNLTPIKNYLNFPLEVGTVVDVWTVVSISDELKTPLQTFSNVIVLEQQFDDGALSRSYFADGFGEIKREYIAKDNGNVFKVTSVIERIE